MFAYIGSYSKVAMFRRNFLKIRWGYQKGKNYLQVCLIFILVISQTYLRHYLGQSWNADRLCQLLRYSQTSHIVASQGIYQRLVGDKLGKQCTGWRSLEQRGRGQPLTTAQTFHHFSWEWGGVRRRRGDVGGIKFEIYANSAQPSWSWIGQVLNLAI